MKTITSENFHNEVINSDKTVLLEFYSDSCIPCKRMSPILAELEEEYADVDFKKLNVNFSFDIAEKYSVMASPTILLFRKGSEVSRIRGIASKTDIEALLKEALI